METALASGRKQQILHSQGWGLHSAQQLSSPGCSNKGEIRWSGRGRGYCFAEACGDDTILVERLRRTVECQEVDLRSCADGFDAEFSLARFFSGHGHRIPHGSSGGRTPHGVQHSLEIFSPLLGSTKPGAFAGLQKASISHFWTVPSPSRHVLASFQGGVLAIAMKFFCFPIQPWVKVLSCLRKRHLATTQRSIDLAIRLVAIAALVSWCFLVIRPFLPIVLWATILAIGLHPPFLFLKRLMGQRATLAAALLTLLGIGIIVGPVAFLGVVVFGDVQKLYQIVASGQFGIPPPPSDLDSFPILGEWLADVWPRASSDLGALLAVLRPQLEALAKVLLDLSTDAGITIIQLIFSMIVAAGFMLNAGSLKLRIARVLRKLAPEKAEELLKLSTSTIQNVIRGVIGVAVVQTAMVGVGLVVGAIPAAGLLILICFVLVLVQLGPALIVLPSIIYAWMTMDKLWALIFTIWMVAAGTVDNIMKPIWMGKGLPVPILIVFLGVIGGTLTNGVLGLFMGPVVLAVGYDLLRIWTRIEPSETITTTPQP